MTVLMYLPEEGDDLFNDLETINVQSVFATICIPPETNLLKEEDGR